ncbi:hypothetical protein B0H10DRAFT_2198812 [Mycena sp. CBHHK59/15]|nr:hypothetical protein B0H10DRAFT_2198812 [Mycena sp. CBHHK59/15]
MEEGGSPLISGRALATNTTAGLATSPSTLGHSSTVASTSQTAEVEAEPMVVIFGSGRALATNTTSRSTVASTSQTAEVEAEPMVVTGLHILRKKGNKNVAAWFNDLRKFEPQMMKAVELGSHKVNEAIVVLAKFLAWASKNKPGKGCHWVEGVGSQMTVLFFWRR